ncbi:dynein heavy chain 10, axonemal-like [Stegodyphus dumicola]|uniref:dynein heavy chain 10, axonemal-like n=1 Tax=Stegodyphus dumicola TaxID=202533 RepID=UPI0015AFD3F2|nr:dynein heavy chain 10, axonemal-like [Stegodyphus dumicola]
MLQNLETAVSSLKEEEIHILTIPNENLCSVLDLGVNNIQWDSYEVPEFLKKMKQATDVYRGVVTEIKNVILEIDKQIKLLSDIDLFLFPNIDATKIPTCEVYFGNVESKMERKVTRIVNIHSFLETLLKSLEKITSKTTTREAKHMRKYYLHCEEKILISLIQMMLSNLEYLKDEVLQHFVFPYVRAAFNSGDEFVIASLTRIKLVFVCFIKNVVESTRRIIRWLDGTCIKSQPFHLKDGKQKMEFSFYLDISLHPKIKDLVLKILFDFFAYVDELNATKEKLNNTENSSLIIK